MNETPPQGHPLSGAGPRGGQSAGFAAASTGEYEFSPQQEQTISALASSMNFTGTAWLVFGALVGVFSVLALLMAGPFAVVLMLAAAVLFAQGLYTRSAAEAFHRVTTTRGDDVTILMSAFADLYKLYNLLRTIIIAALVLGALLGVLLMQRGAPAVQP